MSVLLVSCGEDTASESQNSVSSQTVVETSQTQEEDTGEATTETSQESSQESVSDDDETSLESSDSNADDTAEDAQESWASISGYQAYSPELVWAGDNTILFFHAPWCSTCKAADSAISSGTIPDDVLILKTDFDTSTDLRKQYGVTTQHTFVQVDSDGNKITSWVGDNRLDDILSHIQ